MKKFNDRILFVLLTVLFSLVILFALSFFKNTGIKKINSRQSALLNPKYNITGFTLSSPDNRILRAKNIDGIWGAELYDGNESLYFLMDTSFVNNFILFCQKVSDFNVISESGVSKKELNAYYLDDKNSVCLSFFDDNGNTVSKIHFGALNQTMDKIFFRTEKNFTVYSMDSKIEAYLDTDSSTWCDKNMIPECLYKNKVDTDVILSGKKISSLRFSKIVSRNRVDFAMASGIPYRTTDGSGTTYIYHFSAATVDGEDCYVYNFLVKPSILFTPAQKDFISKLNGLYCISEWTFKLLDSTSE